MIYMSSIKVKKEYFMSGKINFTLKNEKNIIFMTKNNFKFWKCNRCLHL